MPTVPEDPAPPAVQLRRELVGAGWTDQMLLQAVRDGSLVRPRRGAYTDGAAWRRLDPRARHRVVARAVVASGRTPLVVSHSSALAFHGGPDWGLDLTQVDVTRRDHRTGRAEAGVRQHRGRILDGDLVQRDGVWVTTPTRAALELTTQVGVEVAVVHLNDLLHRGLTDPECLAVRYASMERWPRSLATDLALRLADGRCESVAESRFLVLAWQQGLPHPTLQYVVADEAGEVVARLDFAWPEHGVYAEVDGMAKYADRMRRHGMTPDQVLVEEKRREALVQRLTGWRCVRVLWGDLEHPARTALMLRRALFPADSAA